MKFNSIRSQVILLFIPLIVLPLLISGIIGAFYFQETLKQNIQADCLAQARSLSAHMDTYVPSLAGGLKSLAIRPYVVNEMASLNVARNTSVIDETLRYGTGNMDFRSIFVTDTSGIVVASYPRVEEAGMDFSNKPYVKPVLSASGPRIIGPLANVTGKPAIFISVPITDNNGMLLGAMVGELDPETLGDKVLYALEKNRQYIYMVNGTGFVIVHSNRSFMENFTDFSAVPMVQSLTHSREGVSELYDPVEQRAVLAAYSQVMSPEWGVVVAIPTSVAYRPVTNVLWWIATLTFALIVISLALTFLFSKSISDPILGLYNAARAISNRQEYKQYLPLRRKDEIGQVAVCIDRMAGRIREDRQHIMEAKDRAELYLDVMGHDINNLNQTVLGNLELIKDEAGLTKDEKESIDQSLVATRSSAAIIDNVRKLQKIAEERPGRDLLDISDLILECIGEAPRPADKKVTINYTPKKGLVIRCVPLIKEVFCNIINNSIKYSGPEVTVDIETGEAAVWNKKYYTVSVSDNGIGIPDVVKPKLFNRFLRGTTKAKGKGLGLYIVKSLLEKCDGSVKVEDRVPGDYSKGAKFTVAIPAAEEAHDGNA